MTEERVLTHLFSYILYNINGCLFVKSAVLNPSMSSMQAWNMSAE